MHCEAFMFLSRVYATRPEIPKGAEQLYTKRGSLFVMEGATRDFNADNPWDADGWNLTEQGRFISQHGEKIAVAFAKMAGTTVGALKPSGPYKQDLKVLVQRRNFYQTGGATGGTGDDNALAVGLATKV